LVVVMQKFGFPDLSGGSLLEQFQRTRVVRCDEAPWRFLGLSLAGYNPHLTGAGGYCAVGRRRRVDFAIA
jgi:hypothetical protein